MDQRPIIKGKVTKFLEANAEENIHDIGFSNAFSIITIRP
jgi:hypothetical protein